ncbi:serine hydrolase [Nonomuraea rhizosphaerae]|uniref:serine hydrolase n=1 Tax=Nonomuraea rhizosphaerae TaxID=2665663 RepID=UPI001C5F28AC|nr:serine hydrolase [Nonomuraea rhizosphaerae]
MRVTGWAVLALVSACQASGQAALPPVVAKAPHPTRCLLTTPDPRAGAAARVRLGRDLERYLERQPGRVVYAAHDLATGVRLGHGEHQHDMITASGAKVDILTALLLRRARLDAGERDLASRMIRESDNSAADALWGRVGAGDGMSRFYRRVGLRETVPGPSRFWGGTLTSPADRLRLLKVLVNGSKGLGTADRDLVLGLMGRVQRDQSWGVSAAARQGERVALKNGWTPRPFIHNTWAVTSYGRILGPGRDLLLSVQTDRQPGEGAGIETIEGLARMIGRRLADLSPLRTRPCAATP